MVFKLFLFPIFLSASLTMALAGRSARILAFLGFTASVAAMLFYLKLEFFGFSLLMAFMPVILAAYSLSSIAPAPEKDESGLKAAACVLVSAAVPPFVPALAPIANGSMMTVFAAYLYDRREYAAISAGVLVLAAAIGVVTLCFKGRTDK